jgi:putative PIN family toxin of toxin-antitoxin system
LKSEDPDESGSLIACVDANVFVSALAFDGVPERVVDRLLAGDFAHVTGENILAEIRRNAVGKLKLAPARVDATLDDIRAASTVYVPTGRTTYIAHAKDNAVLEVALTGCCTVLVTGDRKHLLPLSPFRGLILEPPSAFLERLRGPG